MLELIDRFGNKIPPSKPVEPEPEELVINGIKLSTIRSMEAESITEMRVAMLEDGRLLVDAYSDDTLTKEQFEEQLNLLLANVGVLDAALKEKIQAQETVDFVGNLAMGGSK